jgi:lysophospholipase
MGKPGPVSLTVALTAALAACRREDVRAPFTDSRSPPGLEARFQPPAGWTWGLIQVGRAPAMRYGVSAAVGAPRGQVLILADYGHPAETWFETAGELNRRGLAVWVLEAAGQGGSGRWTAPRDLGHARGFAADVAAVRALAGQAVRARPLTVVADGSSAAVGLLALKSGSRVDRLLLSAPRFERGSKWGNRLARLGFARWRAGPGWRRGSPDDLLSGLATDPQRSRLRQAWQLANPDLRMGSPTFGWRYAAAEAAKASGATETSPCAGLSRCRVVARGPLKPQLADDRARAAWLDRLTR